MIKVFKSIFGVFMGYLTFGISSSSVQISLLGAHVVFHIEYKILDRVRHKS